MTTDTQTNGFNRAPHLPRRWRAVAALWACAFAMAGFAPGLVAQTTGKTATESGPIQITADELVSQVKDDYAEFIGNVEAVQGDFVIRSDRLRIHYRRAAGQATPDPAGGNAIEKIEAIGRVRIKSGSREAQTELAEYLVDEGLVVLKGKDSIVTDGSNSIRGSMIKLNRLDGKISVVGGPTERVRAVFHPPNRTPNTGEEGKGQ